MNRFFLSAAVAAAFLATTARADGIEVHDVMLSATMVSSPSAAAYMVIYNHGGPDDRLVDAISPIAARVEIHESREGDDGMMAMIHLEDGIALPADGRIALQRGGYHVMFMGLNAPLTDGAIVPLTLVFERAGEVALEVPVRIGAPDMTDHGEMDHDTMDHDEMSDHDS